MKVIILFAVICFALTNKLQILKDSPITIKINCDPSAPFVISNYKVTPDTIKRGIKLEFKAVGSFKTTTTVNGLRIQAKIAGIVAQDTITPIKEETVEAGKSYIYNINQSVPSLAPPGNYEINIFLTNNDSKSLSCMQALFNL